MMLKKLIGHRFYRWVFILPCFSVQPCFAEDVPADFSGNWMINYGCQNNGVTCDTGSGDYFELYGVTQVREQMCGYHVATGNKQRRIDEGDLEGTVPSVYGRVSGNRAIVTFVSTLTGEKGSARVTLERGKLVWDVLTPLKAESWFPDHAVLRREPAEQKYPIADCSRLQ